MKEEDKRAVALNSLTSIGKEYVTLSDGTTIGEDVLKDLKKLMELELREKYKVNKTKWKVITKPKFKGDDVTLTEAYEQINNKDLVEKLKEKFTENQNKIKEKEDEKKQLKDSNNEDTNRYKRVEKKIKELNKFFVIDMVPDTPISFNTIVKLDNEYVTPEDGKKKQAYCVPYIEINKDPKEIATILNDKKELDKIFREKQFKSFDDMVILDFYNEITKKLSDTKDFLRKTDPDIRQDIIDDLYKKLFALYDIKEYNLKDRNKDKDDIKEKYIKDKIRKNNNLSIGGGDNNYEVIGGGPVLDVVKDTVAKGVVKSAQIPAQGIYKVVKKAKKVEKKITDVVPSVTNYVVKKAQEYKDKAEKFLEADKFLHIVTESLKNKSKEDIDKELNISLLKELLESLNENSIYKENIQDLIDIHDSLSSVNRENLLEQELIDAKEYIGKKKEASGNFIFDAVENYKNLKKSFVDKVNKDKDVIEKILEQEAGDNFAIDITFDEIIDNNSETYIKMLKNMNSFLYLLKKNQKGGAAPMYDVQKLKKDDGEQESSGNTPLDYYKKLKDTYIETVNLYYKLIDDIGEEETHYKFIYKYDGIKDDYVIDTDKSKGKDEESESLKNLKAAYSYLHDKVSKLSISISIDKDQTNQKHPTRTNDTIFKKDDLGNAETESHHPSTKMFIKHLYDDTKNPEKKSTINYYNEKNGNWDPKTTFSPEQKIIFQNITKSLISIQNNCYDENNGSLKNCPNILDLIKENFEDTSKKIENERKLNELNEKILLIENRIKLLDEIILKLPRELEKLYKVMKSMKGLPQATEYEEFVINILKRHKIEFFEKDKDKDKHPIIKSLNNEKYKREDQLKKLKSKRDEARKAIEDENSIRRAEGRQEYPREFVKKKMHGGGSIKENEYKKDLELNSEYLTNIYNTFKYLIENSNDNDNLHNLMKNLKEDVEYLENNDDVNKSSDNSIDNGLNTGIYEDIWYDYSKAVNLQNNKKERWKNYLLYLTEGEKVHDRVIENNLDPQIVLKINFRDKSIYIFLMFLIRTINIITLEFLIEYNIMKTLQYTIILYGFMYLFIITLLVILVNYDSYKLRILFNYLNIHINSSNLLLQNILFIIFIVLVYILVKSDDFLKYFGDIFDFTNIYNNIYKFNESLNEDSDINLTQNEKLKLLYRIDIISMIIFIFSAFLVLIL